MKGCQIFNHKKTLCNTREALEDGEGININGQNITNIRYADDTIILAESEQQLQHMIDKLDATCEQYGMAMNAKKTKTMIVETTSEEQCEVNVKGQRAYTSQAIQIPGNNNSTYRTV